MSQFTARFSLCGKKLFFEDCYFSSQSHEFIGFLEDRVVSKLEVSLLRTLSGIETRRMNLVLGKP